MFLPRLPERVCTRLQGHVFCIMKVYEFLRYAVFFYSMWQFSRDHTNIKPVIFTDLFSLVFRRGRFLRGIFPRTHFST